MLATILYVMGREMAKTAREVQESFARMGERVRSAATKGAKVSDPSHFAVYQDKGGLFEIRHPPDWIVDCDKGLSLRSSRMGSFARVDVIEETPEWWKRVAGVFVEMGGTATMRRVRKGPPEHIVGQVDLKNVRFRWDGWAWRIGGEIVILSLGNVIDSSRSRLIERYEDATLDAIRRLFVVKTR